MFTRSYVLAVSYDSKGRVTSRTCADGASEQYAYDDAIGTRRYTDPIGHVTSTTSSKDGRSSEATTPLGQKIFTEYDSAALLVSNAPRITIGRDMAGIFRWAMVPK